MNRFQVILSLAFVMFFTMIAGCIPPPSLNPIFTDKDIVFDPDLVGSWTIDESSEVTFQKGSEDFYDMTSKNEQGIPMTYVAYLGKIGNALYLDLYLDEETISKENPDFTVFSVPVHWFLRMKKIGTEWEIAMLDYDWLKTYMEEHPDALAMWYSIDVDLNLKNSWGPEWVITASTKEIQDFLIKCEGMEGAFKVDDTSIMKRIQQKEK